MFRTFRTSARVAIAVAASATALTAATASAAPVPHTAGPDTAAPVLSHHFIDINAPARPSGRSSPT
jgi:hypothetical protein